MSIPRLWRRTDASGVRRSDELRRRVARRPGPLKVEAAQVAVDVEYLADEVQAWALQRLHGLGGHFPRVDTAQGDLGGPIALGGGWPHAPGAQRAGQLAQLGRGGLLH